MTVIFQDNFTGSGTITGHAADIGYPDVTWQGEYAPSDIELIGNAMKCVPAVVGNYGIADYGHTGAGGTDYTPGVNEFHVTMEITTGLSATPTASESLFNYTAFIGDKEFLVGVYESSGEWLLHLNYHSSAVVTFTASTTYTITLDIVDGAQTCSGFGETLTDTEYYISPVGSQGMSILLGGETTIDNISATGTSNGHVIVDAYAPVGTLEAYAGASFTKSGLIPALSSYAGGTVRISPPAGLMSVISLARAYLDGTVSAPTLASFGGGHALLSPRFPSLTFLAHDSYTDNAVIFTAPTPILRAYGGARAALDAPMQLLASAATSTTIGSAALVGTMPTLSAAGLVSATAGVVMTAPTATLIGYGGAVCSVALNGGPTLYATGTGGAVGSVAVTVPMAELSAGATAQNYGSVLATAPAGRMVTGLQAYLVAPAATLTAIGTATVAATYEAYALNLNHPPAARGEQTVDEMTRYTNFPFTHVVRYQNSYYGVASGALYLLEGTTDDAAPIGYTVQTAKTDFSVVEKKTISSAYFGGRIGSAETISLIVGESGTETYSYITPRSDAAQSYRQAFGRGVKARYYALGVSGSDTFELDTIDLNIDQLTRRI